MRIVDAALFRPVKLFCSCVNGLEAPLCFGLLMDQGIVVVGRDGRVDAVGCGASPSWVGLDLTQLLEDSERKRFARWLEEPQGEAFVTSAGFDTEESGPVSVLLIDVLPLRRAAFSPRDLVMRAMDLFMEQARNVRVALKVSLTQDLPETIDGDEDRLAWVLATLIGNALRIMGRGSKAEGVVEISAGYEPELDEVLLTVRDNGPGMPPERARWLFEPDPSTGRPAGLALVMVREVLNAHGGSIDVESEVLVGTKFILRLPVSP